MPSSDAILTGLTQIANEWRSVAIAWHVTFAVTLLAILAGWRPTNRVAGYFLTMPLATVSAAAWTSHNPFNAAAFVALLVWLLGAMTRVHKAPIYVASPVLSVPGALLVVFGWGYPHFLETDRWTTYAYAAPLGLLPCPTLSAVIGVTLMLGLLGSRSSALGLAAAGLVYGALGVFALGVTLDYILLAGALVILGAAAWTTSPSSVGRPNARFNGNKAAA